MKTDKQKQKLTGPVKSLRIERLRFQEQRQGQFDENLSFTQTFIFNPDGWLIEQAFQNPDGSVQRTLYDYSNAGKVLARSFDSSGIISNEVKYLYHDGKLIAEQSTAQAGKINTRTNYSYQNDGRKIKIQEFHDFTEASGAICIEETNTGILGRDIKVVKTFYDDNDNVSEVKAFNTQDAMISRVEIIRDPAGNLLEEIQYVGDVIEFTPFNPDSDASRKMAGLTDKERREAENKSLEIFAPGNVLSRNIHQYDGDGRLIESKLTMMGIEANRQTFSYDETGNKSEEIIYQAGSSSRNIFTYEYDAQGNWTREIISTVTGRDGNEKLIPPSETRRNFVYFSAE